MTGIATFGNLFDTKRTSKRKLTIKDIQVYTKFSTERYERVKS